MLQTPRGPWQSTVAPARSKLLKKRVRFRQGVPYWQKSVTYWFRSRPTRTIGGAIQRREVCGFSAAAGTLICLQRFKIPAVKDIKMLPVRTFAASFTDREGSPMGSMSERSGGGPGGTSRARLHDAHAVPSQTAAIYPLLSQPRISFCICPLQRSRRGSHLMSHSKMGRPCCRACRRHAAAKRPLPEKISSAMGPWRFTWSLRLSRGFRQYACWPRPLGAAAPEGVAGAARRRARRGRTA